MDGHPEIVELAEAILHTWLCGLTDVVLDMLSEHDKRALQQEIDGMLRFLEVDGNKAGEYAESLRLMLGEAPERESEPDENER